MKTYQIAVIIGSLRKDSYNRKMANAIMRLAPPELTLQIAEIGDLPLYNQDDDANQAEPVKRFKALIAAADGLLFVTPEYNRSMPGVLKNAIDHGSRPHGKNAWDGKPAGLMGVSPGAAGTAMSQQHLRNVLSAVGVSAMSLPEAFIQAKEGLFDEAGNIGPASKQFLQGWMDKYAAWIKKQVG